MARSEIILGTPPQGTGGDTPRAAFTKINAMTQELYQGLPTAAEPLPVNKGGTGGKNAADARTNLGLGTAATADVGTASGNVMPVGAGGWLGTTAPAAASINDYQTGFKLINPNTVGATDLGYQYGAMLTLSVDASDYRICQLFFGQLPGDDIQFRTGKAGTAKVLKIYHSGNTTRAGDGTLKAI